MDLLSLFKTKSKLNFDLTSILFFRLLFGLYFKFSTSKVICYLAKLYCISVCLILNYLNFKSEHGVLDFSTSTPNSISVSVESTTSIIISLITEEAYVINYHLQLKAHSLSIFPFQHNVYSSFLAIFVMFVENTLKWFIVPKNVRSLKLFIYNFNYLTIVTSLLTPLYIFDMYRKNIKLLRKSLCNKFQNTSLTDNEKVGEVKFHMNIYKKLTNNLITTSTVIRIKILFALTCNFIKIMFIVYRIIFDDKLYTRLGVWCVEIFIHFVLACAPTICMELAANDLDAIKIIFVDELMIYKDRRLRFVLRDAVEYIEGSSSTLSIWNGLPINVHIILGFISLCSTYVIAFLQFTY